MIDLKKQLHTHAYLAYSEPALRNTESHYEIGSI